MRRVVVVGVLAVVGTACAAIPGLGRGADTQTCVEAWNHGTVDGKPSQGTVSEGQPGAPGASYGFYARRVAVAATENGMSCSVTFDLGDSTFSYHSGSTGWDPRPRPDISGWLSDPDVRPLNGPMALETPDWNACQRDDGTVTLDTAGCLEHPPPAPPGRVADLLEERMWIAMSSNTRGSDLGDGRNAYWLGPRFDGALAMPGSPVPGDASVQATYYLPDGDRVALVQVLSYNRRLDAVPCLGDDYQCANGLPVDVALLARRDTAGQTVLITAGADASIGAAMRRRIRAALQPVSATSPHPDLCPGLELPCDLVGVGAGLEPAAPPPPPTVEGPVYWLGPSFHGEPIVDNMALPGTTAYLYTLIDHHTSVRVVTVTPGRLGACIHSRYCSRSVYAGIRRTPAIATVRRGDRWVVLIQNGGEPLPAALVRRMVRAIQPA